MLIPFLQPQLLLQQPECYAPYGVVKDRKIRARLIEIARRFQFLDRGFAEYFRHAAPTFDQARIINSLAEARQRIARKQGIRTSLTEACFNDSTVLGDLGHYCEYVADTWKSGQNQCNEFTITHSTPDTLLHYVQDAFEVPYWHIMLELFLHHRANTYNLTSDVVLRVMSSVRFNVLDWRRQLLDNLKNLPEEINTEVAPILKGIDLRIDELNVALDGNVEESDLIEDLFDNKPVTSKEQAVAYEHELPDSPAKSAVIVPTQIVVFLACSLVPLVQGFALQMQEEKRGQRSDAAFWFLLANNIMAILGSVVMVTQQKRAPWFSAAHSMMWVFCSFAVACAIVAVVIYPHCNKAWSSLISYVGAVMAQGAVLVMMQAPARGGALQKKRTGKQKAEWQPCPFHRAAGS